MFNICKDIIYDINTLIIFCIYMIQKYYYTWDKLISYDVYLLCLLILIVVCLKKKVKGNLHCVIDSFL